MLERKVKGLFTGNLLLFKRYFYKKKAGKEK
jgi:hypothetical protein